MQQMMEAMNMAPLSDQGPGLSFGGPGRSQKQLHHQTRDYRNTRVVKLKVGNKGSENSKSLAARFSTAAMAVSQLMVDGRGPFHNAGIFKADSYYTWTNQDGTAGPGRNLLINTISLESSAIGIGTIGPIFGQGATWSSRFAAFNTSISVGATMNSIFDNFLGLSSRSQLWVSTYIMTTAGAFGFSSANLSVYNLGVGMGISVETLNFYGIYRTK